MSCQNVSYKYTGSTPGADANTYVLFSTVDAYPSGPGGFDRKGITRFVVHLYNPQALTLKAYWSPDGGTTWREYHSEAVVASTSSATQSFDFNVSGYRDWKVSAVNGGSAQTGWNVLLAAIVGDRSPATS